MSSPIYPESSQADPSLEPLPFDLKAAAALLDEAGWTLDASTGLRQKEIKGQNKTFDFTLLWPGPAPDFEAALNQYKNDLLSIGVRMNPQSMEWAAYQKRLQDREFEACSLLWATSGWEHDFDQIWHSRGIQDPGSSNHIEFSNKELDQLSDRLREEMDDAKRIEMVRRIGRILYEEQPYCFFGWRNVFGVNRSYVKNVTSTSRGPARSSGRSRCGSSADRRLVSTYLLKRLLLMIPTLVGISLIVFLMMVAAPGRPGEKSQAFGEVNAATDPTKEKSKGESQRIFRRQFALDRPVFWNGWTDLSDGEVRAAVETAAADQEVVGIKAKREAKEHLEDWGYYAVPRSCDSFEATDEVLQARILYWLRYSATRLPVQPYGRTLDEETLRKNALWAAENAELAKWSFAPGDPPARRAEVVSLWRGWFATNRSRWEWNGLERAKIGLTDTQFGTYWATSSGWTSA